MHDLNPCDRTHLLWLPPKAELRSAGALVASTFAVKSRSCGQPLLTSQQRRVTQRYGVGCCPTLQALLFMLWSLLTALNWRLVLAGNLQQVTLLGTEQRGSSPTPISGDESSPSQPARWLLHSTWCLHVVQKVAAVVLFTLYIGRHKCAGFWRHSPPTVSTQLEASCGRRLLLFDCRRWESCAGRQRRQPCSPTCCRCAVLGCCKTHCAACGRQAVYLSNPNKAAAFPLSTCAARLQARLYCIMLHVQHLGIHPVTRTTDERLCIYEAYTSQPVVLHTTSTLDAYVMSCRGWCCGWA